MDGTYRADEPRYEKGDRVWVLGGGAVRVPGLVIGRHVDWNLYRVVYTVEVADQGPKAIEEWRLSFRKREETQRDETTANEGRRPDSNRKADNRSPKG